MTRCPLCTLDAPRSEVHAHLVADHPDHVRTWMDDTGRMRYEVECPACGDKHMHRVKPRGTDPEFLKVFAGEIRLVAFDMLLCHVEAEHDEDSERSSTEGGQPFPTAGPGGGRGRPGDGVVPLPPGMPAPTPGPFDRPRRGVDVKTWKPDKEDR